MTFSHINKSSINLFLYKLIWLQEIFIFSGIIGTMLGFDITLVAFEKEVFGTYTYYAPLGSDPTAQLMGSMAIALVTLLYGFLGALSIYLIQKFYEMKSDQIENVEIEKPKEGFLLSSFIYSILFLVIYTVCVYFGCISLGISFFDILLVKDLIPPIILIIIIILFYKGDSFINLIKNLFWYLPDTKKNIEYNLNYIRNMKKIAAMFISVSFLCVPIVMLGSMVWRGLAESNILGWNSIPFIGLKNGGFLFLYIMDLIIVLTIIEGREVSKLYFLTGKISSGDRFYSLKYVMAPAFLLFFTFSIGIVLTFIIL